MGHPQPLFICFRLSKQTFKFLQQINVKNVMSIQYTYGVVIQTHNLSNMSRLP